MGLPARLGYEATPNRLQAHTEVAHYSTVTGLKSRLGQDDMHIMNVETFLASIANPLDKGRANKSLHMLMALDGHNILPRYEHINRLLASGAKVDIDKGRIICTDGSYYDKREFTSYGIRYADQLARS